MDYFSFLHNGVDSSESAVKLPENHQKTNGQHGQGIPENEHQVTDMDRIDRQQNYPNHQCAEIRNAQVPGAFGPVCFNHLRDDTGTNDQ